MIVLFSTIALISVVVFAIFFGFQLKEIIASVATVNKLVRDLRKDLDDFGHMLDTVNRQRAELARRIEDLERAKGEAKGEPDRTRPAGPGAAPVQGPKPTGARPEAPTTPKPAKKRNAGGG